MSHNEIQLKLIHNLGEILSIKMLFTTGTSIFKNKNFLKSDVNIKNQQSHIMQIKDFSRDGWIEKLKIYKTEMKF